MIEVTNEQLKIVIDILNKYVPKVEVRAFGSRYKGTAKKHSDLDLVLVGKNKIEFTMIGKIKEAFEECILPFRVDILDWHSISAEFKKIIKQGYEVIKKAENGLIPYGEYKQTDMLWLNNIPEHWKTIKIKYLFKERIEKGYPNEPLLAATQTKGVIPKSMYETRTVTATKDLHLLKLVKIGDFVISLRSFQGGLEYAYYRGIISPAYTVIIASEDVQLGYFRLLSKSKPFLELLKMCVTGIREGQNIDYSFLKNSLMPLPPRSEQDQIVRFLDSSLAKINKFIKAKKKLIAVLKEQKQAVINEAVTKGINPNVKMKPSGIEWLGDVPEGWEVRKLFQIANIVLSGLDKKSYTEQNDVFLCNYTDVYRNDYITNGIDFMKATASASELSKLLLLKCDIIITKDSESWDDIAVPAYVAEELEDVACAYHLALIRATSDIINSEFLYNAFLSQYVDIQYKVRANGVTRYGLGYQSIKEITIFIPPIIEQESIVKYTKNITSDIKAIIAKTQQEIDLITEYRTRLISDVVTGKGDVRGIKVIEDVDIVDIDVLVEENEIMESED
jgi:type I restriction enzyme S subunit